MKRRIRVGALVVVVLFCLPMQSHVVRIARAEAVGQRTSSVFRAPVGNLVRLLVAEGGRYALWETGSDKEPTQWVFQYAQSGNVVSLAKLFHRPQETDFRPDPSFSPDGAMLMVRDYDGERSRLEVCDPNGPRSKSLLDAKGYDLDLLRNLSARWLGRRILLWQTRRMLPLEILDPSTGGKEALSVSGQVWAASDDGCLLLVWGSDKAAQDRIIQGEKDSSEELMILDDKGEVVKRLDTTDMNANSVAAFSPGGGQVAFQWYSKPSAAPRFAGVRVVSTRTGDLLRDIKTETLCGLTDSGSVLQKADNVTGFPGHTKFGPSSLLITDPRGNTNCLIKDVPIVCVTHIAAYYTNSTAGLPYVKSVAIPRQVEPQAKPLNGTSP